MRTNGTLQYLVAIGGGFDEDGVPTAAQESWSEPIPCAIRTVTNSSAGRYEDGKFNQWSYEVLVEEHLFHDAVKRVRLVRGGESLGDFPVQGRPTPVTLQRVKLNV